MKIINISGEDREFMENGFIYEFPNSSGHYTEVPDELGKRLISTGQFKEFCANKKVKIEKEVKEDAI